MTIQHPGIDRDRAEAILDARMRMRDARIKAERNKDAVALPVIIARAGGTAFALPIELVAGVASVSRISPIPSRRPDLRGAIVHRGTIWTVFCLATLSGGAPDAEDLTIIRLRHSSLFPALCVSAEIQSRRVPDSAFAPLSGAGGIAPRVSATGLRLVDQEALMTALIG